MNDAALAVDKAADDSDDVEGAAGRAKAKKAPNAFRTISEVADDLHIPQHVLRFWETKFPQVKPLKRGGGRRYYRPDDIGLLRQISDLLYNQGYTIKGVQRLLREGGGRLADNIPPPSAEEKAEAAAAAGEAPDVEPQLPMPGLEPVPVAAAKPATKGEPRAKPVAAKTEASKTGAAETGAEVARLRALLARTLAELQSLRGLLP